MTCGSGGVGKTTTAAALGLRAAEQGRRVVVLTIDPARRLAQSLGLTELDNTPRAVHRHRPADGALLAMMLDMKRTFDEVVLANTTPDKAEQIFANPFYQSLSASFAGTQEYMAMEKLSQLRAQLIEHGDWDLIVVDTPPSRSALDFLDAPQRLGRFLDGRMIRLLTAPARAGGKAYLKVVGASFSVFTRVLNKILGNDLLANVSAFVASLETMFGGFRERAEQTYQLLKAPGHRVRGGRLARAGRAARGVLLRRAAAAESRCRWPGWCSTGCTGPRSSSAGSGRWRRPSGWPSCPSRRPAASWPRRRCWCTPRAPRRPGTTGRWWPGSAPRTRTWPSARCRRCRPTSTIWPACAPSATRWPG